MPPQSVRRDSAFAQTVCLPHLSKPLTCLGFVNFFILEAAGVVSGNHISQILPFKFFTEFFSFILTLCSAFFLSTQIKDFTFILATLQHLNFSPVSQPVKTLLSCNTLVYHVNPSSIELSTNLISIPYMIFSSLCQCQLGNSGFFKCKY